MSAEHPTDPGSSDEQGNSATGSGSPAAVSPAVSPDEPDGLSPDGLSPDGDPQVRELATIPAVEVITRASVMLMSAAAEKLGLAEDGERYLDLDEARRLIEAYAGLLAAAQADLGVHRQPLRDGLKALQEAFREASAYPDAAGQAPGEKSGF